MFSTNLVVTIAQEEGSQGREIAQGLAHSLRLTYVDETVIGLATENLSHNEVEVYIRELARRGRVVILGCAANFILQDFDEVLNVLIEAPLTCRIERVMQEQHLDRPSAEGKISELDGAYACFVRRYYGPDWINPELYDLLINTQKLTTDESVGVLSRSIQALNQHPAPPLQTQPATLPPSPPVDDLAQRYLQVSELLHN